MCLLLQEAFADSHVHLLECGTVFICSEGPNQNSPHLCVVKMLRMKGGI